MGERRVGENIQSYNSQFLSVTQQLQEEGIDTQNLYLGFWYMRKLRCSKEQRERVMQYAYSQGNFLETRKLLDRARRQGRSGVAERGRIAAATAQSIR
eukprot:4957428-Amphidinium_carterae.1